MRAQENHFSKDNYILRHTTGHNMLDPESLISGAEIAEGMTYENSHRDYLTQYSYDRVCSGMVSTHQLLIIAPRVYND